MRVFRTTPCTINIKAIWTITELSNEEMTISVEGMKWKLLKKQVKG